MKKFIMLMFILLCNHQFFSQHSDHITGTVLGVGESNKQVPLPGANVFWLNTQIGTATDNEGMFHLDFIENNNQLVVSYIGYKKDTITVSGNSENITIILSALRELDEVIIIQKASGVNVDAAAIDFSQIINKSELSKAACCNLSESFETNPSVDVSYKDAVTGAKQIQLLGLSGKYSQLMIENIPNLRGLATTYGLGYVPGPWMESIQISKGASTVVNGYESVTGHINIVYKKPENSEKFYLNVFSSEKLKSDINTNVSYQISDNISTLLFVHGEYFNGSFDDNTDSFLDIPRVKQFNIFNRWQYKSKNWNGQIGISALGEERRSGQINIADNLEPYKISINTNRYQIYSKLGYVFDGLKATSIGFINMLTGHNQRTMFGLRKYNGKQLSGYSNLIFETSALHKDHKINMGASFVYDNYTQNLDLLNLDRVERVPGLFFQHTFSLTESINLISGIRADFHNIHGTFYTPRFHVKYSLDKNMSIRASAGKGFRSSDVISENTSLLASSRNFLFEEKLKMEEAWNYGISITKYISIANRDLTLKAEFYRTDFINSIIADTDKDVTKVFIHNQKGESFSSSFQVEANYELINGLDVLAALRFNDVQITLNNKLQQKPLLSKYKGLLNLSYTPKLKQWQFDFTTQFNGNGRLPNTENNPTNFQREKEFPSYIIMNAQFIKYFQDWEIYIGAENLTNFIQANPIISASNPYGNYFDASMVWGPITGRKFYAGMKYSIN